MSPKGWGGCHRCRAELGSENRTAAVTVRWRSLQTARSEGHLSYGSGIVMGNTEHFGKQSTAPGNVVVDIKALLEFRGGALIPSREIGKSKTEPLMLNTEMRAPGR